MAIITSLPCMLCREPLSTVPDVHEEHLKHKIKFHISWIIRKTLKERRNPSKDDDESTEESKQFNENVKQFFAEKHETKTTENKSNDEESNKKEDNDELINQDNDILNESIDSANQEEQNACINKSKPYKCSVCDKTFKRKIHLMTHKKIKHNFTQNKTKPYQCSICKKAFKTKWYVIAHEKKRHTDELIAAVKIEPNEYEPEVIVKQEPIHEEDEMEKLLQEDDLLNQVEKIKSEKGKENNGVDSKIHKRKPNCDQCGNIFKDIYKFNRHMMTHTGEKPFPCDHCEKRFSRKDKLKNHQKSHTQSEFRPYSIYSCSGCDKTFKTKSYVEVHEKIHIRSN